MTSRNSMSVLEALGTVLDAASEYLVALRKTQADSEFEGRLQEAISQMDEVFAETLRRRIEEGLKKMEPKGMVN